ncbi:MAG: c-type cytochrome [Gemmatimonadota bacterium]
MSNNALRNILIGATVFVLGVVLVVRRGSLSELVPSDTPTLTADAATGEHVFQNKNCSGCHSILGSGGNSAPDLTTVIARRDPVWLARWLANPQAMKPGTAMPRPSLAAADVTGLVAFFRWVGGVDARATAVTDSATGAAIFKQKGCSACHRIGGQGPIGIGPDLSRIGGTPYDGLPNTPEFLAKWLDNPPAQKANTMMPRMPLTPAERDVLVRYLTSLK